MSRVAVLQCCSSRKAIPILWKYCYINIYIYIYNNIEIIFDFCSVNFLTATLQRCNKQKNVCPFMLNSHIFHWWFRVISKTICKFAADMSKNLYIISGCNGAGKTTASYTVWACHQTKIHCRNQQSFPSLYERDGLLGYIRQQRIPSKTNSMWREKCWDCHLWGVII